MEKKFQHMMSGAGLMLLLLVGVFAMLISNARADRLTAQTDESLAVADAPMSSPNAQVMEEDPISNALNDVPPQSSSNLGENIQSPLVSNDADTMPVNDTGEAVLARVAELNTQRMNALLATGGGWLFVQRERHAPNSSNAPLPNGHNLPVLQLLESWYYIDTNGLAYQSYDRMLDESGMAIQEGYFKEGTFYDQSGEPSDELGMPAFAVLPDQDAYGFLVRDFEVGAELVGWVEQRDGKTVYVATSTTHFDKPVEFGVSPDKVISTQYHFIYAIADGAFLYGETVFVLEGGEQIVWESIAQITLEIVPETALPEQLTWFLAQN